MKEVIYTCDSCGSKANIEVKFGSLDSRGGSVYSFNGKYVSEIHLCSSCYSNKMIKNLETKVEAN